MVDYTRTYSDSIDLTDTKKSAISRKISNTLKVSDDNDNAKAIDLAENIRLVNNPPVCPVILLNTEMSTRNRWAEFSGTLQQVINLLDTKGIPEQKVKGMAFTSAGRITVLVNKQ